MDEQSKRHFRRVAYQIDRLLRTDGYDVLIIGGHEHELPEFPWLLPHELRGRVASTFCPGPATPVAEIEGHPRHDRAPSADVLAEQADRRKPADA